MATIEIFSNKTSGGGGGGGNLQLSGGVGMTTTLVAVTDTSNVASPLKLSTTLVQTLSTLKITTADNPYIDAEDNSGNNRFTIGRDPSSQQVNLDFASNPTGSTTMVGAIRTYQDGVNLSEAMQFREDGDIFGSGTQTTSNFVIQKESNNDLIIYSPSTFGGLLTPPTTGNANTMLNGSLTGSHGGYGNVAIGLGTIQADGSAYNFNVAMGQASFVRGRYSTAIGQGATIGSVSTIGDFATAIGYNAVANGSNCFALGDSTAKLQIGGNFTPTARVHIQGSGSTSATNSLIVQNSSGTSLFSVRDDGVATFSSAVSGSSFAGNIRAGFINSSGNNFTIMQTSDSTGNAIFYQSVAIGTTSPPVASAVLEVVSTTKGFLPPRMTNAQKNAITSPAEGLIVHDTTNNGVAYYNGSTWGYLSGAKQTLTGSGGTLNIPFRNGNIVDLTLNSSTTLTFASHVVGTFIIQVTQGGAGSNTLTYPASVKWSGGTAPTLTTAVGKTDILTFYHDGTSFFGTYSLNY